jgi:hypothetical protein
VRIGQTQLRVGRVLAFGVLAEVATVVAILVTLALHSRVFAAGQPQAVIDDFAQRAPAVLGPAAGALFTFIAALLATRPLEDAFRTHGLVVGAVAASLTIPGLLDATPFMRPVYLVAIPLKLAAGVFAGWLSERRRVALKNVAPRADG